MVFSATFMTLGYIALGILLVLFLLALLMPP